MVMEEEKDVGERYWGKEERRINWREEKGGKWGERRGGGRRMERRR